MLNILLFVFIFFSQTLEKKDFYIGYLDEDKNPVLVDTNLFKNDSIILKNIAGYFLYEDPILISFPFEIKYVYPINGYGLLVYKIKNKSLITTLIPLYLYNNELYLPNTINISDKNKKIKIAKNEDLPTCRINTTK